MRFAPRPGGGIVNNVTCTEYVLRCHELEQKEKWGEIDTDFPPRTRTLLFNISIQEYILKKKNLLT